jgi:hypothetical protein
MLSPASKVQSHTQGEQFVAFLTRVRPSLNCQYKGGPTIYTDSSMANNTSSNFSKPGVQDMGVGCAISNDLGDQLLLLNTHFETDLR